MNSESLSTKGFTLIEVTLATVFVGFIITILAATTTNVIRSYNKGIWLAQINTAGQQLNDDIGDKARYSGVATLNSGARRLCVGGVSYVWNTQVNIDKKQVGSNKFSDGGAIRLVRIDDPNAEYCSNTNKTVDRNDKARILLGRGAIIQDFKAVQGVGGNNNIPLLTISVVISTEGTSRPIRAYEKDGQTLIDPDGSKGGHWQCGDWIDKNGDGVPDAGDIFTPSNNQYCSFAQYNITVYERSLQK